MRSILSISMAVVAVAATIAAKPWPVLSDAAESASTSSPSPARLARPKAAETRSTLKRSTPATAALVTADDKHAAMKLRPVNRPNDLNDRAVAGGPINDACDNALPVSDGNTPLDNRGATTDGPEELSCNFEFEDDNLNFDIWYDYTSTCTGELTIRLCGTPTTTQGGFDTKLAVYPAGACPPTGGPLACNDDGCPLPSALASAVSFRTIVGESYKLRVGAFVVNGMGMGSMSISCTPDFPACTGAAGDCCSAHGNTACDNTACCEAVCSVNPPCCNGDWNAACVQTASEVCTTCDGGSGEECPECIVVRTGIPLAGSTAGAMGTNQSSCAGASDTADVWHCWRATCTGTATMRLCDTDFDTTLAVFDSCGGTEVACDDDGGCTAQDTAGSQVRFPVNLGTVYRVRVAGFGGTTGDYTLSARCDVGPSNDACANAVAVEVGTTEYSTIEATTDGPVLPEICDETLGVLLGNDVWFDYLADCSGIATFSTCNDADYDTRMAVYYDCDCPVNNDRLTGCNDDAPGCDLTSEVSVLVAAGSCYKVRVGAFQDFSGAETGVGNLTVTCRPPAPNNFCEDASIETLPAVYTGNNEVATDDCPQLFPGRQVWAAFRLTETSTVTLSYCGSEPVFEDAWLNLTRNCPCSGFTEDAAACRFCEDGNPQLTWFCLPAGVYYYPILSERGSVGDYRIEVVASPCQNNNLCAASLPISNGITLFSNVGASTDGPTVPAACDEGSGSTTLFNSDIWYNYQATCTGVATVSTCGTANFNTRLAMYTGTSCPVTNDRLIGCDDNTEGCSDQTSLMQAPVTRNDSYKIRVGGRGSGIVGAGCIDVACAPSCPAGTIVVSPQDGSVDAQQPRDPNADPSVLLGIDRVTVTGPGGASAECFELCEPSGSGLPANSVIEVVENPPGTYLVRFQRAITPNAATVLRYLAGATARAELFYHPGNVNGGTDASADDALALVAFFFDNQAGALPWGVLSGDIDRDEVLTLMDIPALLNVLNGAGSLDSALGTPKPVVPEPCR